MVGMLDRGSWHISQPMIGPPMDIICLQSLHGMLARDALHDDP